MYTINARCVNFVVVVCVFVCVYISASVRGVCVHGLDINSWYCITFVVYRGEERGGGGMGGSGLIIPSGVRDTSFRSWLASCHTFHRGQTKPEPYNPFQACLHEYKVGAIQVGAALKPLSQWVCVGRPTHK